MIKEFATLKAAALAGCDLCMDIGSIVAARRGVIERQLLTLHNHTTSPAVDDRERLVVDLLVGMTATPAEVADALWLDLREHFVTPAPSNLPHRAPQLRGSTTHRQSSNSARESALPIHALAPSWRSAAAMVPHG